LGSCKAYFILDASQSGLAFYEFSKEEGKNV
jgi:hypothetical protein